MLSLPSDAHIASHIADYESPDPEGLANELASFAIFHKHIDVKIIGLVGSCVWVFLSLPLTRVRGL